MKKFISVLAVFFLIQTMQVIAGGDPGRTTSAKSSMDLKPYVGASIGQVDIDGFEDDGETSFTLYGGAYINKHFGVEAGYGDFGDFDGTEVDGFYIAAVAKYPVANKVEIFGRLGVLSWNADHGSSETDGSDTLFGVGVAYQVNKQMKVVLDYNTVEVDNDDADMFAIGVQYNIK